VAVVRSREWTIGVDSRCLLMVHSLKKVFELSAGKFDAVRTLRDALAEAERGNIDHVIIIAAEDEEGHPQDLWCTWSHLTRVDVLWMTRWLNSKINHRYFSQWHKHESEGEDA